MTRDELDTLWQQALVASVRDGEKHTRYHFAALVAAAEREACIEACESVEQITESQSWVVSNCIEAILERSNK
jgi:glycerol-3-phosphate cytidylyltransferase-like family protein